MKTGFAAKVPKEIGQAALIGMLARRTRENQIAKALHGQRVEKRPPRCERDGRGNEAQKQRTA